MTIFVGMDGSEGAEIALQFAVCEGELRDLPVTALVAWDLFNQKSPAPDGTFDPQYDETKALATLDAWVVAGVGAGAAEKVGRLAVVDLPWKALVAAGEQADLLVVGARGIGGFLGLRLGSVSERVLHHATCPVAVVHQEQRETPPTGEHIVVGVDGSATADKALRWALDEARARHARVTVVTVWSVPVTSYPGMFADGTIFESAAREVLDQVMASVDASGLDHPIDTQVVPGSAPGAILDAANDATLIVVGSRGLSRFKSLMLGSVSLQVVHHAMCPVVVVPHDPEGG